MKKITDIDEIKRIQLDILIALDRFCRKNDIRYFLIDGTLLGAIRHKGYIPWDDDIDVALDRKNYDRLMREFPDLLEGKYKLHSLETNLRWDRAYGCISDERTQLVYDGNSSYATGILIDIFPIDEVPDNEKEWRRLQRKMKILSRMSSIKASSSIKVSASHYKNITSLFLKLLLPFSLRTIAHWRDGLAQLNNDKSNSFGYEVAFGLGAKNRFKLKDFEDTVDVPFEGHQFMAPVNFDSVLTDTYGDYMQLPPEEERVSHHTLQAFWK